MAFYDYLDYSTEITQRDRADIDFALKAWRRSRFDLIEYYETLIDNVLNCKNDEFPDEAIDLYARRAHAMSANDIMFIERIRKAVHAH